VARTSRAGKRPLSARKRARSTRSRLGRATKRRPATRLRDYAEKRDFTVTPEPAPRAVAPPAASTAEQPSFMVHKHHARRLHYDLRLEIDGALASWGIPRGPSYDPTQKRLAVETEDHPLEYGGFEGRIPDGEYGAGDSLIWDRGHWDTVPPGQARAQRQKGHLHVELYGEKLRGRWHLVRTRASAGTKPQWLFFKARDPAANPNYDVIAARPESVLSGRVAARGPETASTLRAPHPPPEQRLARLAPPMLATLVSAPPADEANWILEVKYDGFRALAALSSGRVALWSRNRLDLSGRFPRVVRALGRIAVAEAVLDGEIVASAARGASSRRRRANPAGAGRASLRQRRANPAGARGASLGASPFQLLQQGHADEAVLVAFDLLWLDGRDLRERPLEERRDWLVSVVPGTPDIVRLAQRVPGPARTALAQARARGWEGLIAKQRGSRYLPTRSRSWLKLKVQASQELAVIGFERSRGHPRQLGSLLLGVIEGGRLRYAGGVGTGFTARQRSELLRELSAEAVAAPEAVGTPRLRHAVWVKPRRVAEVRFTEWTADGRLRHPTFQGWRPDRTPADCVLERPVRPPRSGAEPPAAASVVRLSHPERVLWPRDGITKQDLADYYAAVAGPLLSALAGRPLALEHYPEGLDASGWFRQNLDERAEPWLTTVRTPSRTRHGSSRQLVADRPETLRWLAQHGALAIHTWSSRVASLEMPDWLIFELDPAAERGIAQAVDVALGLRRLFDQLSLPSLVKTSGGHGLHVLVPLAPGHTHADALAFAVKIGETVAGVLEEVTLERSRARRRGRLYLDCLQNGYGKTVVAPYSPRAVDGAPVSAPLRWSEVNRRLDPPRLNLRTMPKRVEEVGDLYQPVLKVGVRLPTLR
jgi:bifunctional non-homologous end joining protein LigD